MVLKHPPPSPSGLTLCRCWECSHSTDEEAETWRGHMTYATSNGSSGVQCNLNSIVTHFTPKPRLWTRLDYLFCERRCGFPKPKQPTLPGSLHTGKATSSSVQDHYSAPTCDSLGPIYLDFWLQPVNRCSWYLWATLIESPVSHAPNFCPICSSLPSQTHGAWFCRGSHLVTLKDQGSPTAIF